MDKPIEKRELKLPARASLAYILSGVFGKAVGFFATLVFTRLLSAEEYGSFTLYTSWLGIAETASSAFISASMIYKGLSEKNDKKSDFLSAVKATFSFFSAIICLLLFVFMQFSGFDTRLLPFIFLQVLLDGFTAVRLAERKHSYSYRAVCLTGIFDAVLGTLISYLLIRYAGLGYFGRVLGFLIPSVILTPFSFVRGGGGRFDSKTVKYILGAALPLLPHAISLAVTSQTDKLIITSLLGTGAAAKYSVVHSFAISGIFFVTTLGSALNPWIQRKVRGRRGSEVREICGTLVSAFASFTVIIVAIAPLAVAVLAPKEYAEALPAAAPVALSIVPYFAASVNTVYLVSTDNGRAVSVAAIVSAVLGTLSSFIFIGVLGYFGAGLGTLIASAASFGVGAFYIKKRGEEMVALRSVLSSLGVGALLSLAVNLSYSAPYIIPLILIFPATSLVTAATKTKSLIFEAP